ncbi:MAG: phospho-N-acetylmuramoyl-pentapeptide-transferase [Solirubrobacteraceae bacterium]
MLYYLFEFLEKIFVIPGAGLFKFLTFRAMMAGISSLVIALIYGKKIIEYLKKKQMGETIRELGLDGQIEKKGTPTMGGIIIILATLIPTLLFSKPDNIYIITLIITMLWMSFIGGLDDYIKIFRKDKDGLAGKFKIVGQVGLGLIVGSIMYIHPSITIKEQLFKKDSETQKVVSYLSQEEKSFHTTVPLFKNNEFSYDKILFWLDKEDATKYAWLVFIPIVIFIITAVSNSANLTDGIDGLAAGSSVPIVSTLAVFAWVSGNVIFSDYLNIMYIPNSGEITIFIAAFLGGIIGFLWYNSYPAQIFMGDTGSLTIGGVIAVIAILIRKELIIPVLCGVFFVEASSVILQVSYFKYTKKFTGEGKRIFLMSPLHHHFQKLKIHESKIVSRFIIIGGLLALITLLTLKIR